MSFISASLTYELRFCFCGECSYRFWVDMLNNSKPDPEMCPKCGSKKLFKQGVFQMLEVREIEG